ncbi:Ig-like domain repeat protein [Streptomyces sp. NPDC089919]|uniref:Ig-like domain repeat protein n=1 Tax=Streptomyces sp. NPDC089919 TaxID=3155188 RepID=UPI00343979C6
MRTRTFTAATALGAVLGSAVLAAGPAAADSHTEIPVSRASDVVADGVHHRVFVSAGGGQSIVVTDFAGKVVGSVPDLPYVSDLALSRDSATLYAAVRGADKIVAVDTATLKVTASYPTGERSEPSQVAVGEQGRVWFSFGDQWDAGLGSIDPAGQDAPVITKYSDEQAGRNFAGPPLLRTDPKAPGRLVALDHGISSGPMMVYDTTGTAPAVSVQEEKGGFYYDAAFAPDGASLFVAGSDHGIVQYRLSDLKRIGSYPMAEQPSSVAVAPDGTVAAGSDGFGENADLTVFSRGADKPASLRKLSSQSGVARRGLAWAPDGGALFAGNDQWDGVSTLLSVLDHPRRYETTATLTGPATAARGAALTLTGRIGANLPLPAGTPVTVTRTDMESPQGKALPPVKLDAKGAFSVKDTPPAGGQVTYRIGYAGDDAYAAAQASFPVTVSRAAATLTLGNNNKTFEYGAQVWFIAHLGPTYKNRTVELWADPFGGDKPNKLMHRALVDARGNIGVRLTMTRDTTVVASFAGDARYAPKKVTITALAKVKVATSLSGHYKTAAIGGVSYRWFHKTTSPVATSTMTYYPGRKARFELEVYSGGRWHAANPEYFKLGTDGRAAVRFGAPRESGIRARVRSGYINVGSGDYVNSTTLSAWQYMYFSN